LESGDFRERSFRSRSSSTPRFAGHHGGGMRQDHHPWSPRTGNRGFGRDSGRPDDRDFQPPPNDYRDRPMNRSRSPPGGAGPPRSPSFRPQGRGFHDGSPPPPRGRSRSPSFGAPRDRGAGFNPDLYVYCLLGVDVLIIIFLFQRSKAIS
jgi:hypothetical protein